MGLSAVRPCAVLSGAVLALALSHASPAGAQTGRVVERLLQGTSDLGPARGADFSTPAANRYAVIIGNSDYASVPDLPNALADGQVVAEFLGAQGYEVHQHENITKREFEEVLRRILFDVDDDTEVVVFFAGHGFQIGSENYLVPVDADLANPYDVPFEAVSLGSLVGIVGARARLQIIMLDSCRDNPFAGRAAMTELGSDLRETRTGFTSQAAPLNSMLVFSTAPGSVAYDGLGDNSPFTAAFITEASAEPEAPVTEVFEAVRRNVYQQTGGRQIPWDSSTLVETTSFGRGASSEEVLLQATGTGESRGVARIPDGSEDLPADLVQVMASADHLIQADFVPEVVIGPALIEVLGLGAGEELTVLSSPETGRLMLPGGQGPNRDAQGDVLGRDALEGLVLSNRSVQRPAGSVPSGILTDSFEVERGGETLTIALELRIDPCDFEAGDHLDPDGMGITRYANELRPEIALAACTASIAAQPQVGRFHYQQGRALDALRRYDESKAAYETARDLGHTRAWRALGTWELNRARRSGGYSAVQAPQETLELYARGVSEGDPYAFYGLGLQLLNYGETAEEQIEGYDLIMRSLEVGHTFAMNAMGDLYTNPERDYFDPARGIRYYRESAARGDIYGYYGLGYAYFFGIGPLDVDYQASFEWMKLAADGGHPAAPYSVGLAYADGSATGTPDPASALDYYLQGLDRGLALAGAVAVDLWRTSPVEGYDAFDMAAIAARGAALTNAREFESARQRLETFSAQEVDGGSQTLLRQLLELTGLEGEIGVDGSYGADSRTTAERIVAALDPGATVPDAPVERAVYLASLYWKASPFRVDLY